MSNLSLLVDCKKIIQWLQDRKKLTKDWYNYVKAAEEKIKVLIKEKDEFNHYPELIQIINNNHESKQFHLEKDFCFEDVNNFVNQLLKTDLAKQKSLLFGYGDKRVKEWVNLRKFMQSKSIGLLSNAKFIEQGLKFDLPGLNKNIEMMDSQLSMLKRKIDFNQNTIYQQQVEMVRQIANVGLESVGKQDLRRFNIESQIPQIMGKVPDTMRQIQQLFSTYKLQNLLNMYRQRTLRQGLQIQMPMLQHFIAYGNDYVDVYKGITRRELYSPQHKYGQFTHWRPVNQWGIEIEIEIDDNMLKQANSIEGGYQIEQLSYVTIIEDREMRQQLLYNLNELMYFFIGLKTELLNNSKRLDTDHSTPFTQIQLTNAITHIRHIITLLNSKLLLTPLQLKNNKQSYQYFITKFHNIQKNIQTLLNQINDYQLQIETIDLQRTAQVERLRALRAKLILVKKQQEKLLTQLVTKEVKIVGQINKLQ